MNQQPHQPAHRPDHPTLPHPVPAAAPGAPPDPYAPAALAPEPPAPEPAPEPAAPGPTGSGTAPRTRRRRRSPIIAPGLLPALLTTVIAGLLAATAPLGRPALAAALVLLQALTAAGWFRLNGMWPARQGIALAFLAGVTANVALLSTGDAHAPAAVLGTLGVWFLLVLVLQLRSRSAPDERLYALTAGLTATVVTVLTTGFLVASEDAVVVGAAAVAGAALLRGLPLPAAVATVLALGAAPGVGLLAGRWTAIEGVGSAGTTGALLGLAAGIAALLGLRVASYDFPSRFVHLTAGVALPLAIAAPIVYAAGRALG